LLVIRSIVECMVTHANYTIVSSAHEVDVLHDHMSKLYNVMWLTS